MIICHGLPLTAKGHNSLHQFPRSKSVTSWRLPVTSLQHKRQVRNKSVKKLSRAKVRCVCCAVSFPKFHYSDLLPASWRLPRLMDFGHNCTRNRPMTNTAAQPCYNENLVFRPSYAGLYTGVFVRLFGEWQSRANSTR